MLVFCCSPKTQGIFYFQNMAYTGKYACPTSEPVPPSPGGGGGLSVGSILCIV